MAISVGTIWTHKRCLGIARGPRIRLPVVLHEVSKLLLVRHHSVVRLTPPIVVAEGMDVSFYASEEAVDRQLEPWFVEEDYRAFDAVGRKAVLRVERREVPRQWLRGAATHEYVVVDAAEDSAVPDELALVLREWLAAVGAPAPTPGASLAELLEIAVARGDLYR